MTGPQPTIPKWAILCIGGGVAIATMIMKEMVDFDSWTVRIVAGIGVSTLVALAVLGVVRILANRRT